MDRSAGRTASRLSRDGHKGYRPAAPERHARAASCIALLAIALLAALALGASSASALVVQLPAGKRLSYQPLRGAVGAASPLAASGPIRASEKGNLIYHGGPIMPTNTNYTFYWSPGGASAYPEGYVSGIDQYLGDLAKDSGGVQNVDSVATQYSDEAGEFVKYNSHFAEQIVDTDPYPKNGCKAAATCLTDEQLQEELKKYVLEHGLPTGLEHEYFILTPSKVESCFEAEGFECSAGSKFPAYCAYHGFFHTEPKEKGPVIVYANDPYVVGNPGCDDGNHPNNKPSDAALEGGLSHEHNESITDPELNAWWASNGEENGDKCRTFNEETEYGTQLGETAEHAKYNQVVNGSLLLVPAGVEQRRQRMQAALGTNPSGREQARAEEGAVERWHRSYDHGLRLRRRHLSALRGGQRELHDQHVQLDHGDLAGGHERHRGRDRDVALGDERDRLH